MASTYARILEKIKSQSQPMVELAWRALTWVVTAKRLLKPEELAIMIAIDSNTRSIKELQKKYQGHVAIEACCGLLKSDDGFVRPIHFTVEEFLKESNKFIPNEGEANSELARRSIEYFLCKEFRCIKSFFSTQSGDGENRICESAGNGGLAYIFSYWDEHLREARRPLTADLRALLKTLFECGNRHAPYTVKRNSQKAASVLSLCAAFDIFEVYNELYVLDNSAISSKQLKEAVDEAARGGSVSTVEALLSLMNEEDGKNHSSIHEAACRGHAEVVHFFISRGVKIDATRSFPDGTISTAFAVATENQKWNVMKILIESGADVNTKVYRYGTALQCAATHGNQPMLELLLANGADVNICGGSRWGPLHAAASGGQSSIVKILLSHGADPKLRHKYHGTPVEAAARGGHQETLQILLANGAKVDANRSSALSDAAREGNEAIFEILLAHGASATNGNHLQAAVLGGSAKIINTLLAKVTDVDAQGGEYGTALQAAAYASDEAAVQMLFDKGADVNAQGGKYGNALQAAACSGHEAVVQFLLEKGADVNAQGGEYGNALQAAAYRGYKAVVRILLEKGANFNAEGGHCSNALQASMKDCRLDIAALLVQ